MKGQKIYGSHSLSVWGTGEKKLRKRNEAGESNEKGWYSGKSLRGNAGVGSPKFQSYLAGDIYPMRG